MDEPSAWEDINPPMVSAQRRELQSLCSERLQPASTEDFRNELTACLTLVAPVGMTEEAKRDWLAVAWGTLRHLPADLLKRGCAVARERCDHPSKIVPTIAEETARAMDARKELERDRLSVPLVRKSVMDRRGQPMSEAETTELNALLEHLGAHARYRPDGSRYTVETA